MKPIERKFKFLIILFLVKIKLLLCQSENNGIFFVKLEGNAISEVKKNIYINDIIDNDLKIYLNKIGFIKGEKVFTDEYPNDTLAISKEGQIVKQIDLSGWYTIFLEGNILFDEFSTNMEIFQNVISVSPVTFYNLNDEVNDPHFWQQKGLKNGDTCRDIHIEGGWELNTGRNDVKIAIIDSGVDYNHLDLDPGDRSRVIEGYDTGDDDDDPMDDFDSHGTKVAGVIGAITNNNVGIAGIMWNLKIIPVKVASDGWGPFNWYPNTIFEGHTADGINWATNNGADIINMSLGGYPDALELFLIGNPTGEVLYNSHQQGVLLIASAGNDNNDDFHTPSGFSVVMSVGATGADDLRTEFSNYGNTLNVCAPGGDWQNYSTTIENNYNYFQGTSCSAPMVSGVAGLILSMGRDKNLELTNEDIWKILEYSADDIIDVDDDAGVGWDEKTGFGRINAESALSLLTYPYTFEHNSVTSNSGDLVCDSHTHTFSNNGGLPSGLYFGVKTYKVSWHVNFDDPYDEIPIVWMRGRETVGWSSANPNYELPYSFISNITNNGFDVETYIYWIEQDLNGGSVQRYWPSNSTNFFAKISYSVIGKRANSLFSNEIWYDNIEIEQNLLIPHGISLLVSSGTTIKFGENVNIKVNGELIIEENSLLTSISTDSYWKGIEIGDNANISINGTHFKGMSEGIYRENWGENNSDIANITIKNSLFENNIFGIKHGIMYEGQDDCPGEGQIYFNIENCTFINSNIAFDYCLCMGCYDNLNNVNGTIKNNIFYGSDFTHFLTLGQDYGGYNLYFNTDFDNNILQSDLLNINPNFIDVNSGNYQLSWGNFPINDESKSPCIDEGNPASSNDPDGTPVDIGAFYFNQLLGDVNSDGEVNILDIPIFVNYILGIPISNFQSHVFDLNQDRLINITDVLALIYIILENDSIVNNSTITYLSGTIESIENGERYKYSIDMLNEQDVYILHFKLQFDNKIPLSVEKGSRSNGMTVTHVYKEDDYTLNIMVFSLEGRKIPSGYGTILEIELESTGLSRDGELTDGSEFIITDLANNPETLIPVEIISAEELSRLADIQTSSLPTEYNLYSVYPNPFNPKTTITYDVPVETSINISIYDLAGRKVDELVSGLNQPGQNNIIWNADQFSSGVYFVTMTTPSFTSTQKVVLLK